MIERLSPTLLNRIETKAADALGDLKVLAGDEVGPSGAYWQDVAGTAALNLRILAHYLDHCRSYGDEPGRLSKVCAILASLED